MPQIEVTFDIDANGILNVSARDKATGKEQQITITASTNLNKAEVDRMVRQAEINKAADERRKELIEARNEGDASGLQRRAQPEELGDKVSAGDRQALEQLIAEVRSGHQGRGRHRDPRAMEQLQQASYRMSEQAYGAGTNGTHGFNGGNGNGNVPRQPTGEEDVVAGEFRTV